MKNSSLPIQTLYLSTKFPKILIMILCLKLIHPWLFQTMNPCYRWISHFLAPAYMWSLRSQQQDIYKDHNYAAIPHPKNEVLVEIDDSGSDTISVEDRHSSCSEDEEYIPSINDGECCSDSDSEKYSVTGRKFLVSESQLVPWHPEIFVCALSYRARSASLPPPGAKRQGAVRMKQRLSTVSVDRGAITVRAYSVDLKCS